MSIFTYEGLFVFAKNRCLPHPNPIKCDVTEVTSYIPSEFSGS